MVHLLSDKRGALQNQNNNRVATVTSTHSRAPFIQCQINKSQHFNEASVIKAEHNLQGTHFVLVRGQIKLKIAK